MSSCCERCARPIEPGDVVHRASSGDYHGACFVDEDLEQREREARQRRELVAQRDAVRVARARLEADLAGDDVRN